MSTLIFSDTHLGPVFEEKKFNFLKKRIEEADQVIINGDFWEGYLFSFEHFITSAWSLLFPYLKKKNTVYIYGNHDKEIQSSQKTNLFSSVQTLRYTQKLNGHSLVFEHGNRLWNMGDAKVKRNTKVELATYIADKIERILTRNYTKYKKRLLSPFNDTIKSKLRKELKPNEIYVCGHTHLAEFNMKEQFINSGIVKHGVAQYLEISGTTVAPKEEWYE